MSVIYCEACDSYVDTDFDLTHCWGVDCEGCECNPMHWDAEMTQIMEENAEYVREQHRKATAPTMNELRAESEQAKIAERKEQNDQSS